jgi:hypothetical protein
MGSSTAMRGMRIKERLADGGAGLRSLTRRGRDPSLDPAKSGPNRQSFPRRDAETLRQAQRKRKTAWLEGVGFVRLSGGGGGGER